MERLVKTNLELGMTIPWTIFNEEGEALLREGAMIKNERILESLLSRGVWCNNEAIKEKSRQQKPVQTSGQKVESTTPFKQLDDFKAKLHKLLAAIIHEPAKEQVVQINEYANELQNLTWKYTDILLGMMILDNKSPYSQIHPIMASIASTLLAKRKEWSPEMIHLITCANLTANLGMFEIQDEMAEQDQPLTEEQKKIIQRHPEKSFEILQTIGVNDPIWLEIVLKQHEKLDGSGYPAGLTEKQIPDHVRISTLADMYAAMVLPRRYRDGIHCQNAIKEIFAARAKTVDETLTSMFIKDIGVYPPGAYVELSNGEKGIIIKRSLRKVTEPIVSALFNPFDTAYERPKIRNLSELKNLSVKRVLQGKPEQIHSYDAIWDFVWDF